ncbi:DNA-3-methyladenine glycosylase I [Apostasia shenzhenica]|uniref:DNA-3-methyladenine glycosylase I n=1 Tax=Apostasia shenzhenica TaxID=1088818 RepID=A0A2I0ADJ9_9ASPA|nr:DNA-3-methyladenine glycosylase I [Apostasia shenzhenica]
MSEFEQARSAAKQSSEQRKVRRPTGSRVRARNSLEAARKADSLKIPAARGLSVSRLQTSSSESSDQSLGKQVVFRRMSRQSAVRSVKVVPERIDLKVPPSDLVKTRCSWITLNTESFYVSFHDEEWGVPVHDDSKLFELLTLSEALAELNWPSILKKRDMFKKIFENFNPSSVAAFDEKKILLLKSSGGSLLSEQKLRAVVENAKQILKVIEEFGSFSNYCWRFVNHKPVINGFRYGRQVPVKTPKAEAMSRDMMQRGFRCVGPTIIYSFMQVAGIVNDHLLSCFRFHDCIESQDKNDSAK